MKEKVERTIKIKIAICLNKFLQRNKELYEADKKNKDIAKSYNDIALNADLRKATVSDVFNGKNMPEITTLFPILEAMGYTLIDFATLYNSIKTSDVENFKIE